MLMTSGLQIGISGNSVTADDNHTLFKTDLVIIFGGSIFDASRVCYPDRVFGPCNMRMQICTGYANFIRLLCFIPANRV